MNQANCSLLLLALLLLSVGAAHAFVGVARPPLPSSFRRQQQLVHKLSLSATTAASTEEVKKAVEKKVPVHLLAGFLGSGKTTTLKHVLENTEGIRVGVIVNDVAAVNIDAKLVNRQSGKADGAKGEVIEMQNGCACCTLADELLGSVERLMQNDRQFDAILIELSGVADPVAIQNNWKQSVQSNSNPAVTDAAKLSNVITVVDACTFGTDYMSWDATGSRPGWVETADCVANRKVVELLAEQVEAASLIVVNKSDLADPTQVEITNQMVRSLNDRAGIVTTAFGKVSAKQILIVHKQDDSALPCQEPDCTDASHSHSHSHDHAEPESKCAEPGCTDASHSHSHDHATTAEVAAACEDLGCTDPSHSHSHSHDHDAAACADPDCTDATHSHSHDHQEQSSSTSSTSTDNLGISNFVYKAQRPFDAGRLMEILYKWPVPIKDELDLELLKDAAKTGYKVQGKDETEPSPFTGVLRSKGFCWFSPTRWEGPVDDTWRHSTAMYWSHAGKHLGVQEAGRFWASVPNAMMKDFFVDNEAEYNRVLREDFVSEEFGDRRQELVFIGVDLDEAAIRKALDQCLLSDEEMDTYRSKIAESFEAKAIDV
jgi:G3E family GTPase